MKKSMICISCPIGCRMEAELLADGTIEVSGNGCPRGKVYAVNELTDPKRMVTGVAACGSSKIPFVPVRTSEPLARNLVPAFLAALRKLRVPCPVRSGDVLLADFEHTGVDAVATRTVEE